MSKIKPWPEQLELSDLGLQILRTNGLVYLAMEERTGKTLTAILIAEETTCSRILVITKKTAIKGWEDTLNGYIHLSSYTVTNYHQAANVKGEYDLVILDEAHAYISGYPKKSKMWKDIRKLTKDKPIIYLSATPYAQGPQLLYHQLALSDWSPWADYKDFYEWFKHFAQRDKQGNMKMVYFGANQKAIDYKAVDHDRVIATVEHLFITKTRAELGFEQEPSDVLHYIELNQTTKDFYNLLLEDGVVEFTHKETGKDYVINCDSQIKLRWTLHMLEGGGLKLNDSNNDAVDYIVLSNREKIDYILKTWGDTKDVVIMHQYKAEKLKLERHFKHAQILQAQSYAEGVDLSMYKHLIIYSQDFSTAKHTQRRARQANKMREEEIKVHFLVVKKAVSEQVYKTVSVNKINFVDSVFERETL